MPSPTLITKATRAVAIAAAVAATATTAHALTIVPTYDSSITTLSNAVQVENAINFAASQYQSLYSNDITVNITFKYGVTGLGESQGYYITSPPSYNDIKNALQNLNSSSAQITSAAHLPSSDPNPSKAWQIDSAQAKALGIYSANDTGEDGWVMFNQSATYTFDPYNRAVSGKYDFIGVAEHEISEVMGRTHSYGSNLSFTLMRYTSPFTVPA